MLVFIGDTHGQFEVLPHILKDVPIDATVIQVGDFGIWPQTKHKWMRLGCLNKPLYFIDGNHEYFPWLRDIHEPTEVWPGAIYVPRGTVLNLEGMNIGFMGGGASVDKNFRRNGVDWFYDEDITREEFERLHSYSGSLDIMVTHTPPDNIVREMFGPPPAQYGLPPGWRDPSAIAVEQLWNKFGRPWLICGHMHKSVRGPSFNVLAEHEVRVWRNKEIGFENPAFGLVMDEVVHSRERRKTLRPKQ